MIPEGWKEAKLLDSLDKIIDYRGQSVPKAESGIPLITARNIRKGFLTFKDQEFVDENEYDAWMKRGFPKEGDVLFTTEAPLGYSAMFPTDQKYAVGQRTVTLRPKESILDGKYLMYFLLGPGHYRVKARATGSTALGIKSSELKKLKIFYPPYKEQLKIAKILSTWDEAIEKLEKLIEAKKLRKKGLMQQLLTGKKRFEEFKDDWKEFYLEDLGVFSKGKGLSKKDLSEDGIPCVRYGELYTQHHFYIKKYYSFITEEIAKTSKKLVNGDIIFAGSGEKLEDIGKCAAFLDNMKVYVGGDTIIMSPNKSLVYSEFFGFFLNSQCLRRQIYKLGQGHTVVHLYTKDIKRLRVKIPSLEEQKRISSILVTADKEIEVIKLEIEKLSKLKKGLMQQLLTGKKRVKTE